MKYFIATLLFVCGFQSGFIFKCYWDYRNGAVPFITPSEVFHMMQEKEPEQ